MARTFASSTTDAAISSASVPTVVSAAAFTAAAWLYPTGSVFSHGFSYGGSPLISDSGGYWGLFRTNISGTDRIWAYTWDAAEKKVGSTYSTDTWQHFAARLSGGPPATTLEVFKNGVSQGTVGCGNIGTVGFLVRAGQQAVGTPAATLNGRLAELCIYPVALSDGEILALGKGFSPLLVRPEALSFYAPFYGSWSPELDVVVGKNLTITGTAKSDHPPGIICPQSPLWFPPGVVAAPPTSTPWFFNNLVIPQRRVA